MQPFTIAGSDLGLRKDKKPFILPDKAFPVLENAYVWRDRVKKRECLQLLGRLQRNLTGQSLGNSGASPWTFNLYSTLVPAITGEPNAQIVPGSIFIAVGFAESFTDQGNGLLVGSTGGSGVINYATGNITLISGGAWGAGVPTFINFNYYPSLPVMGIWQRELISINDEETIFFDTKYAYKFVSSAFQEFIPGTTWSGSDANFFWATNFRGSTPESKRFFATNFINDANNPMRYTDGTTWTDFYPRLSSSTVRYLTQARILVPYYGRLVALNVWESPDNAGSPDFAAGVNITNRCAFSQIGDPTDQVNGWLQDTFGRGGFIDAPTSESIISATFYKNTLIVFFERTTWQLRYQGEYGIPFIWERISSDFGSESTFSSVLFDQGVTAIGNTAIVASNSITVDRIDLQIPDLVFQFRNSSDGLIRIHGIRNYEKELVYWCYNDAQYAYIDDTQNQYFPNKVLVYNYRNNTYAIFRDNVTTFGNFQVPSNVTWDSLDVFWGDQDITWTDPITQDLFPSIVSGNQQGFVHYYANQTPDDASLQITGVNLAVSPITLTIPNHNLVTGEIIYITDLSFVTPTAPYSVVSTNLNDQTYRVTFVDINTVSLSKWDTSSTPHQYINNFSFTPTAATATYIGKGKAALFPRLDVQSKDFNPYQNKGSQTKLCYIDFLTDVPDTVEGQTAAMTVVLYANTSPAVIGNLLVGNKQVATSLTLPYYTPASDIAWHRFYATLAAQYFRIQMTYDDDLMNQLTTHQQTWVLNAMTLWVRPGGKIVF